jgi:hypothetical protein
MTVDAGAVIRQGLEQRLASLTADYIAASSQLNAVIDAVERERLRRKIDSLEQELQATNQKLSGEEDRAGGRGHRYRRVQSLLPRIDFKEVNRTLEKIFEQSGRRGCAVGFLLQRSQLLGGEHCAARIRDLLERGTGDLKHWIIDVSVATGGLDEYSLLERMARHVHVSIERKDLERFTQLVADRMCDSLGNGSIAFLEVRRWDNLAPQERVLAWFLNTFWLQVAARLASFPPQRVRVRFVALLCVDDQVPAACLPAEHFSSPAKFKHGKLIHFPLRRWKQEDIREWLDLFSGLESTEGIDRLAEKIYRTSKGLPPVVCKMLCEELGA